MSYLTIVMVGSNENYGGDFLGRMQSCVNSIFAGAARHGLDADLLLVEWGTPPGRESLRRAIDWSRSTVSVRIVRVPRPFVDTLPNPDKIFLEPWAKSAGVRRAMGRFVLTTNADSVYSDTLLACLARHDLDDRCFYRVDRHDVRDGKVFRINRANGSFAPDEPYVGLSRTGAPYAPDMLHFNASGEFILMSRDKYHEIRGWPELPFWGSVDGMVVWLAATHGLRQVVLPHPIFHADHPGQAHRCPPWSDAAPYAVENGESWGQRDVVFETVEVRP